MKAYIRWRTTLSCILFLFLVEADRAFSSPHVFFSPHGGCEAEVIKLLDATKSNADAAIYSFNNTAILKAFRRAKARGVKIRILLDRVQAEGKGNRRVTLALKDEGFDVRVHTKNRIQHNKFAVFDNSTVITGSFNWTNPAENANEENCLVIDDASIVKAFGDRFSDHLWVINTESGSTHALEKLKSR